MLSSLSFPLKNIAGEFLPGSSQRFASIGNFRDRCNLVSHAFTTSSHKSCFRLVMWQPECRSTRRRCVGSASNSDARACIHFHKGLLWEKIKGVLEITPALGTSEDMDEDNIANRMSPSPPLCSPKKGVIKSADSSCIVQQSSFVPSSQDVQICRMRARG